MKLLTKRSDGIITVSKYVENNILEYGFAGKNSKLFVVHNGVSSEFKTKEFYDIINLEKIKNRFKLPDGYILYVGRLNERKNILNLLIALKLLEDKTIILVLCGKYDWKMFNLPEKIKELELNNRVILLGHIDDKELPMIYSLARIFIFPSYVEGFGLPPLEAMASGIPIVVSNTTSIPEVCGEAGYYFDPNSPKEIAEQIMLAISDEELREKRIEIGLKRVKEFKWENAVTKIIDICYSIANKDETSY